MNSGQHCKWMGRSVVGRLCSMMVIWCRWILSKECPIFFRCNWTAESWPKELCHSLIEGLFCFPYVQICAILALLSSINYITLLMPGCFVLRVEKLPPWCVTGFKVNRDVVFIEILEFLRYSWDMRNVKTMFFRSLPLCLLWIWTQGLNPATPHQLVKTEEASYMWGETSSVAYHIALIMTMTGKTENLHQHVVFWGNILEVVLQKQSTEYCPCDGNYFNYFQTSFIANDTEMNYIIQ